jgi:hypothetical protein
MSWILKFIVFFIVANPETFKLVRKIFGSWVASADGLPTQAGVILHAIVFVFALHFLWRLFGARRSGFAHAMGNDYAGKASEMHRRPAMGLESDEVMGSPFGVSPH